MVLTGRRLSRRGGAGPRDRVAGRAGRRARRHRTRDGRAIAAAPAVTVKMARRVIAHLAEPEIRSSMADELVYQTFINKSDDYAELRAARAEERPPKYTRELTVPEPTRPARTARRRRPRAARRAPSTAPPSSSPAGAPGSGKAIASEFARLGATHRHPQPQGRAPGGGPRGHRGAGRHRAHRDLRHPRSRPDRGGVRRRRGGRRAGRAC